jgi:MFS family permease
VLGALFCLPLGWLVDRYGVRSLGAWVLSLLAISVLWMSCVQGAGQLFVALLLVRGLGQSALSVVSLAMIGKWFRGRLGPAMGVFSILLTFGFISSILGLGAALEAVGWRSAWQGLGLSLAAAVPLHWLLARNTPEACGLAPDPAADSFATTATEAAEAMDYGLAAALRTPAFWTFVLGTAAFNGIWSSITLFNEAILAELGFPQRAAIEMMAWLTGVGLVTNLAAGKLATREYLGRLLGFGLLVLGIALVVFPAIRTVWQLRCYGAAMGVVGGLVTVVHFAAWGHFFGRRQLGRIQGIVQIVSVLASAAGPVSLALGRSWQHSYLAIYPYLAITVGMLACAALMAPVPPRLVGRSAEG